MKALEFTPKVGEEGLYCRQFQRGKGHVLVKVHIDAVFPSRYADTDVVVAAYWHGGKWHYKALLSPVLYRVEGNKKVISLL